MLKPLQPFILIREATKKKNGKNFTLCVKLGGGQQNSVCEPQKWVFFKLILAKKRTFLTSFRVKNNGLTKTLSLGSKETKLLCLLADIQVSYHYLGQLKEPDKMVTIPSLQSFKNGRFPSEKILGQVPWTGSLDMYLGQIP